MNNIDLSDADFANLAEKILYHIAETIEDYDKECNFDIDLHDGILTISNNDGTFVINKQSAAKEIWLSSPITGPYHFALNSKKWKSKSGDELFSILSNDFKITISEYSFPNEK